MPKKLYIVCFLFISNIVTAAWDGSVSGKISYIQVTAETNYAFRVSLEGKPELCGNENDWAHINTADSNYQTYVSLLTAAKFAGATVTIYTNKSTNGFCKIGHIFVY